MERSVIWGIASSSSLPLMVIMPLPESSLTLAMDVFLFPVP
jgi:hypothetical protein